MKHSDTDICLLLTSILEKQDLTAHFQPIVSLTNQMIYGYEGLIRGPVDSVLQPPTMLFDAATQCGYRAQLDFLCREVVIRQFRRLNLPGRLFINVDPVSLLHENFKEGKTLQLVREAGIDSSPMGCRVITEGVETEQEYALLRKLGVVMVQGYYFSRPKAVPLQEIPSSLFRKDGRNAPLKNEALTIQILLRPAVSVEDNTRVTEVGNIFSQMPDLESIVVIHDNEVLGMVLKKRVYEYLCQFVWKRVVWQATHSQIHESKHLKG